MSKKKLGREEEQSSKKSRSDKILFLWDCDLTITNIMTNNLSEGEREGDLDKEIIANKDKLKKFITTTSNDGHKHAIVTFNQHKKFVEKIAGFLAEDINEEIKVYNSSPGKEGKNNLIREAQIYFAKRNIIFNEENTVLIDDDNKNISKARGKNICAIQANVNEKEAPYLRALDLMAQEEELEEIKHVSLRYDQRSGVLKDNWDNEEDKPDVSHQVKLYYKEQTIKDNKKIVGRSLF